MRNQGQKIIQMPVTLTLLLFSAFTFVACATRFAKFEMSQVGDNREINLPHCRDVSPKECEEKVSLFILFEQTRNIKDIYKDGVFQNDVPAEFQAANQATFRLPYFIIELGTDWLQTFDMGATPEFINKHHIIKESDGKTYFKFPVHPVAVEDYKSKLEGVPYRFVDVSSSEFIVSPTASERTLIRNMEASHPGESYMIKVSLPLEINNRPRILYPTEMKRGIWFSRELDSHFKTAANFLFFFREPFGAYPRGKSEALGATVFREFPAEFYSTGRRVIPLFSFLAEDESGKPLFMRSMPTQSDNTEKWSWYKNQVLNPLLNATRHISYEMGMGMQLHSQNLTIELTADLSRPTGRYGYRDLGGAFLDLGGLLVKDDRLPSFENLKDLQRELGLAYFKGHSLLNWTHFFLKSQVSDLFAIQMATHGVITKEIRDLWKAAAWNLMLDDYRKFYSGQWRNRVEGLEQIAQLPPTHTPFSFYDENDEPDSLDHLMWWKRGNFYLGVDKENTRVFAIGLPQINQTKSYRDLLEPFKMSAWLHNAEKNQNRF